MAPTRPSPDAEGFRRDGLWRPETVEQPIGRFAGLRPHDLALVDRGRRYTYGELWGRIRAAAGMLAARGVGAGDVVSFQLPNWAEAGIVHHATALLGAVSNPIVPIYRARELRFILREAGSSVLVVPDVFREFDYGAMAAELAAEREGLERVLVVGEPAPGTESFASALDAAEPVEPADRGAGEAVLLLYTSGTEAHPKGVIHSHETLGYECRSIIDLYGLEAADRVFMASPLTHVTGVLYGLLLPFMLGSAVVLQDVWDPAAAVALIQGEGCTFTVGATPFLHGIVNAERRADSMQIFVCGGADVPPNLIHAAEDRLGIRATRVYGSSECPTATGTAPAAPPARHAETDGAPIGPTRARVVDEDGAPLPAGERGELQVRGPDLFLGYLDPRLNADAFSADGWFRTGDLAIVDAEGYLTMAGRVKDIILRGGENLSAKEIEDLLFEHPEVAEVAVVGYPDPALGERACAVVVAPRPVQLGDLVDYLRSRAIATQKLPERLLLVDEMPKTASGKVQKYVLRERLLEEPRP